MRRMNILAITATVVLGVSACGGSSSKGGQSSTGPSTPAASTPTQSTQPASGGETAGAISLAADPTGQLKFTTSSLTAKAGKVTIQFTNNAPLAHNLTIQQGTSGPVIGATPTFMGGTKTLTLNVKPGTYTYFCSVPGHKDAGMHGTLTVR